MFRQRSLRQRLLHQRLLSSIASKRIQGSLRGKTGQKIVVGDWAAVDTLIEERDVTAFATLTGDCNAIHIDEDFAKLSRFTKRIAHGFLVASAIPMLFAHCLPGSIYRAQTLRFTRPVFLNDTVTTTISVVNMDHKPRNIGTIVECSTKCVVWRDSKSVEVIVGSAEVLIPAES